MGGGGSGGSFPRSHRAGQGDDDDDDWERLPAELMTGASISRVPVVERSRWCVDSPDAGTVAAPLTSALRRGGGGAAGGSDSKDAPLSTDALRALNAELVDSIHDALSVSEPLSDGASTSSAMEGQTSR